MADFADQIARRGHYERDPLLVEREKTHGNYHRQAAWAQITKEALRDTPTWHHMPGPQRESLDMIITKISRIAFGSSKHKDSWDDIAGYAKLGAEACDE